MESLRCLGFLILYFFELDVVRMLQESVELVARDSDINLSLTIQSFNLYRRKTVAY